MAIGLEHIYEIVEEARALKKRVHASLERGEQINTGKLASVLDSMCDLTELTAKKLDEVVERFVRLEDEVRKGRGSQMRPAMGKKRRR